MGPKKFRGSNARFAMNVWEGAYESMQKDFIKALEIIVTGQGSHVGDGWLWGEDREEVEWAGDILVKMGLWEKGNARGLKPLYRKLKGTT